MGSEKRTKPVNGRLCSMYAGKKMSNAMLDVAGHGSMIVGRYALSATFKSLGAKEIDMQQ